MGKDFLKLVELAVASGALLVPGLELTGHAAPMQAAPSTEAPAPVVQSAKLDKSGLTIVFSEPLAPAAGVDPSKFRLTFAYYSKGRSGGYSYYYDYYGSQRPLTVYSNVGRTALRGRIEQPRANELRIPATAELNLSSICGEIAAAPNKNGKPGLYLHYAEPGGRGVAATNGKPLASVAPYWLTKEDATVTRGTFEGRPIPVQVSCR